MIPLFSWATLLLQGGGLLLLLALWVRSRAQGTALEAAQAEIARLAARAGALERELNEAWRSVEERVGGIHETFESGRACRMGSTVADVDLKMGQLNRKLDQLLAAEWHRERSAGEP